MPPPPPRRPTTIPKFGDRNIYQNHSSWYLLRGLLVFRLCRFKWIVDNSMTILDAHEKVFGEKLTYNTFVKWLMFAHFCGGEDFATMAPRLKLLASANVGPVLDFAKEASATTPETRMPPLLDPKEPVKYEGDESPFDQTLKHCLKSIDDAGNCIPTKDGVAFAAIKFSGLCDPQLLARLNAMILGIRLTWLEIVGEPTRPLDECRSISSTIPTEKHTVSVERLTEYVMSRGLNEADAKAFATFCDNEYDKTDDGVVRYLDYTAAVVRGMMGTGTVYGSPVHPAVEKALKVFPSLTAKEKDLLAKFRFRIHKLAEVAYEKRVRILIDAEQTYYQMTIDTLVRELQRLYNVPRDGNDAIPIVYNTYQCYLITTKGRMVNDFARSRAQGWAWGGKMVRGAYVVEERKKAKEEGYQWQIHPDKSLTDKCYDECATLILKEMETRDSYGVLFGTHNQQSLEHICAGAIELDKKRALQKEVKGGVREIAFAQLLGMGDVLTYPLAKAGFNTFKYVPYASVKEAVHYLHRRTIENYDLLRQSGTDQDVMWHELMVRLKLRRRTE